MRDFYELKDNFMDNKEIRSVLIIEGKIDNPEITIFIPTYKRSDTLKTSIESALNQVEISNYEILIINNDPEGKNDSTKKLIEEYKSDKIYYYVNKKNIGLCGNWNRGIELARGKYVAMVHDDDMLSPWFLSAMLTSIKDNKEPEVIGVSYTNFDSSKMPAFHKPSICRYRSVTKRSYFFGRNINIAGMTIKRDFMMKLGGYAVEYFPNEDSILIYQALLNGRIVNIESILAGYRKEVNLSLSGDTMKSIIEKVEYTRRIIAKHEPFANRWMRIFDREYLYQYISSANAYWGLNIDPNEIYKIVGLSRQPINKMKYNIMRGLLRIEQARVGK